jgi:hypothetical protein
MGLDYILSLRQSTSSRWTAHLSPPGGRTLKVLGCGLPIFFRHQFRFYHTTSHYLCHEMCYHSRLVEIALGCLRNLMILSRRFTPTDWPGKVLTPSIYRPAILVRIVFHLRTTVHRMSLQRQPVRAFITLTMVRSLGFGSNSRYSLIIW